MTQLTSNQEPFLNPIHKSPKYVRLVMPTDQFPRYNTDKYVDGG